MKVVLKETLEKMNISQYQLSKMTGITAGNINNLCNGKTKRIDFSVLDKICEALDCDITDIIIPDGQFNKRILLYITKLRQLNSKIDKS